MYYIKNDLKGIFFCILIVMSEVDTMMLLDQKNGEMTTPQVPGWKHFSLAIKTLIS